MIGQSLYNLFSKAIATIYQCQLNEYRMISKMMDEERKAPWLPSPDADNIRDHH